jgi:hypothetical protein
MFPRYNFSNTDHDLICEHPVLLISKLKLPGGHYSKEERDSGSGVGGSKDAKGSEKKKNRDKRLDHELERLNSKIVSKSLELNKSLLSKLLRPRVQAFIDLDKQLEVEFSLGDEIKCI